MAAKSELIVITKAKDLCSYIIKITEKSPKRFRFTFVSRLQNLSLDIIENLYRANEVYISGSDENLHEKRRNYQETALTNVKLLGYFSLLAQENDCILLKQYEHISKLVSDCQNLIAAWIKSDKKRYSP